MAVFKEQFDTSATVTIGVASLASDTNLLAGREATALDNTSNLYDDVIIGGKIKTGTTTANTQIEIWAIGSYDGTTYAAGATGSDANLTVVSQQKNVLRLLQVILVPDTTARTYNWGGISVAQAFGGIIPKKWSVFIVHNTGAALDATAGNHETKITGLWYQSV